MSLIYEIDQLPLKTTNTRDVQRSILLYKRLKCTLLLMEKQV